VDWQTCCFSQVVSALSPVSGHGRTSEVRHLSSLNFFSATSTPAKCRISSFVLCSLGEIFIIYLIIFISVRTRSSSSFLFRAISPLLTQGLAECCRSWSLACVVTRDFTRLHSHVSYILGTWIRCLGLTSLLRCHLSIFCFRLASQTDWNFTLRMLCWFSTLSGRMA